MILVVDQNDEEFKKEQAIWDERLRAEGMPPEPRREPRTVPWDPAWFDWYPDTWRPLVRQDIPYTETETLIIFRFQYGMTYGKIAQQMGYSNRHKARREVKKAVEIMTKRLRDMYLDE